ncbi:hypothetical protein ACFSC4_02955 [Deinococcus malanensis]
MTATARDPYRDWLRARLSPEVGAAAAEQVIEGCAAPGLACPAGAGA